MGYIFAYDGGGSKTRLNVVDLKGNIVFDRIASGSNIASAGDTEFKNVIGGLFIEARTKLSLHDFDIDYIFLGLSGADLESDYARLNYACKEIFGKLKLKVMNDAWIILRSGLTEPYGAVCICGTGTNSAAMDRLGNMAILRSLGYTLGIYGGGLDIARDALHYAFRADELTFKDTILRLEIPKLLGKSDMDEVVGLFYPKNIIDKHSLGSITGLVDECALKGDEISLMILENVAKHVALQTSGVIRQLHLENEQIPVVIGGRVFTMKSPQFIDTFTKTITNIVPKAKIVIPKFTPVVGAYLFSLDELGIAQTKDIETNLLKSGGRL